MNSASDFGRDHGLIHEAVITGRKAGWGAEEWAWLAHNEGMMRQIRNIHLGHAVISVSKDLIDLDADPFVPEGWKVEEHQKGGQFKWDATKVKPYLSKKQQGGKKLDGNKLREELKGQSVYNANVLDYLLANPDFIPEEWKGTAVFFWGTIYRVSPDKLFVRCLVCDGGKWFPGDISLCSDWSSVYTAAVTAS